MIITWRVDRECQEIERGTWKIALGEEKVVAFASSFTTHFQGLSGRLFTHRKSSNKIQVSKVLRKLSELLCGRKCIRAAQTHNPMYCLTPFHCHPVRKSHFRTLSWRCQRHATLISWALSHYQTFLRFCLATNLFFYLCSLHIITQIFLIWKIKFTLAEFHYLIRST